MSYLTYFGHSNKSDIIDNTYNFDNISNTDNSDWY